MGHDKRGRFFGTCPFAHVRAAISPERAAAVA